jgi:hypothetical protein
MKNKTIGTTVRTNISLLNNAVECGVPFIVITAEDPDFSQTVLDYIQRKVDYMAALPHGVSNLGANIALRNALDAVKSYNEWIKKPNELLTEKPKKTKKKKSKVCDGGSKIHCVNSSEDAQNIPPDDILDGRRSVEADNYVDGT